jgi:hypothetical protein
MIPSLGNEFQKLQEQLDELLQKVKPLTHEQQNFKPIITHGAFYRYSGT